MKLTLSLTALGVVLLGLSAFAAPSSPSEVVTLSGASHSLTIEYLDNRGDYRRAKVTIQPIRNGERPRWRGEIASFRLVGNRPLSREDAERFHQSGISTSQILSSGHVGEVMVAPSRSTLVGVVMRTERGERVAFAIPGRVSGYSDDDPAEDTDTPTPQDPQPDPDTDDWCEEHGYGDDCIGNPFEFTSRMTGNDRSVAFTF